MYIVSTQFFRIDFFFLFSSFPFISLFMSAKIVIACIVKINIAFLMFIMCTNMLITSFFAHSNLFIQFTFISGVVAVFCHSEVLQKRCNFHRNVLITKDLVVYCDRANNEAIKRYYLLST